MAKKRVKKAGLSKRDVWLYHYLNVDDKDTFANATEAAVAARYNCKTRESYAQVGARNAAALRPKISKWLDEMGLSEEALKIKLLSLLSAKKTKFFSNKGIVLDEREVEALDVQTKALDMALKIRGTYAAQKQELSGPGGGPIPTANVTITADLSEKEASDLYAKMIKGIE